MLGARLFAACLLVLDFALVGGAFCQQRSSPAPAPGAFRIAGTVVEAASGRPLANAMVNISSVEARDRGIFCITGSDGRFVFNGLSAGKYSLRAARRGFESQLFQQNDEFSTAIAVGPDLDTEHIVFPLSRSGSLSGTIVDEEGDPVPHATVWIFRKGVFHGRNGVSNRGQQTTDLSGAFHFAHLTPGTYFVGVQARPWYAQNGINRFPSGDNEQGPAQSNLDVAYPATYYGDTSDPASASPIAIGEGTNTSIRIALRTVAAVRLELTGFGDNQSVLTAWASQFGPGGFLLNAPAGLSYIDNRRFIICLAPGRYLIDVQKYDGGQVQSSADRVVDVTGDSTLDAQSLSEPTLSGNIIAEGSELPAGLTVFFARSVGSGPGGQSMSIKDGAFKVTGPLLPGAYQILLQNAPGFYIKSVAAKGAKFSAGQLELEDVAPVQLSLTVAKGLMQVSGIAVRDDVPCAGAMVLLIPRDLNRMDLLQRDQSDSDGTFTLNGVAPGQYTLVAIDDGRELAYAEPSAIGPYLTGGRTLTVAAQNESAVKVNVLPRQPAIQ